MPIQHQPVLPGSARLPRIEEFVSITFDKDDLRVGEEPDGKLVIYGYRDGSLATTITISVAQGERIGQVAEAARFAECGTS